jgi:acyl-CoA thioesterase-1
MRFNLGGRHVGRTAIMPQGARVPTLRFVMGLLWLVLAAGAGAAPGPAPRTLLVLGDSLSAGYRMDLAQGWVALLAARLAESHRDWRVVNASVSGETTAGGAARIADELARHAPALVAIELGANDGLRGLPVEAARANLAAMIEAAQRAGARVLLIGMRMPPNYGPEYTQAFAAMYAELAARYDTALVPLLIEPIARDRAQFQDDNLHPTAAAQPKLLDHVWPALAPLLGAP